ncbi:ABC transporter substrate-binding protein [Streptomyces sp. NPDC048172]|uniref:ABC transporter substrate-binding protein n=1 Tax=Streptomyces sp. NPDC048172 TaxID=3365505 RepID=UPI0037107C73
MSPALNRRRFLAASATGAAGLLAPAVTGCGAVTGGYEPDGLVLHSQLGGSTPGAPAFAKAVDTFRRRNPKIPVKVLTNADDLQQVYETSKLAGKEADLVLVNLYDKSLAWTEVGATLSVDRYMSRWGLRERLLAGPVEEWTDGKGRLRGFPYLRTNWPVAFNTALLERAGVDEVPRTTDALLDAAKKLRRKGIIPVTIGGNDWSGQKLLLQVMQTYMKPGEAKSVMRTGDFSGSPGARRGIELFVELRDGGVFADSAQGLTSDLMTTQISTQKAAIASMLSSAMGKVPDSAAENITVGGWPIPDDAVYEKPTIMRANASMGIWLSPNGEQKLDRVERFVRFMYSEDTVSHFVHGGRDMALRTDQFSTEYPLVAAGQRLSDNDVSECVTPDIYVPAAATQPLIQATGVAFSPRGSARQVRTALEKAYRSAGV